ncbi:adhesin [Terribacillus saccharophilus]|uniref:adhesin n=1 Tax=Terribacillus saccharophilus TaxID=361277 RepID=UPI0038152976
MKITDEARRILEEAMAQENSENIRFYFAGQGCCGPQMGISMDKPEPTDTLEIVNEIQVAMDGRVAEMAKDIVLDKQNGGLVLAGLPEQNC